MESKLPIPTDNIYKFSATFGLALMAISMTLLVLNGHQTNEIIWQNANAIYELQAAKTDFSDEKQKILEKKIEIAVENRDILKWLFAVLFAIGFYGSLYGFHKWYKKIQPMHDEILELQRKKLALEVNILEKEDNP
tara:strand:+ start:30298 stop:30705 length:408 start_codon:yes stop_codon:yes gene_type:complete